MADRYWNPAANANWADANVWALTDGGTANQATPTVNDDVFFTSTNSYKCTVAATAYAKSVNFAVTDGTKFTGEFAGAAQLQIGGSLTYSSAMTVTSRNGATIFTNSSGTAVLNSAGKTFVGTLSMSGAGTWQLGGDLISSSIALNAGSFDANGYGVTISGQQKAITGAFTFYNLTLSCPTTINWGVRLTADIVVTGTFKAIGTNATTRCYVASNTTGTRRTITAATVDATSNYVTFRDIVGAGAGSWDLSAIDAYDAGNNSGITFPAKKFTYNTTGYTFNTTDYTLNS